MSKKKPIKKETKDNTKRNTLCAAILGAMAAILLIVLGLSTNDNKTPTNETEPSGEVAEENLSNESMGTNEIVSTDDFEFEITETTYGQYVNTNDFEDMSFFKDTDNADVETGYLYILNGKNDFEKFFEETGHSALEKNYYFYNNLDENDFTNYTYIVYQDIYEESYKTRSASQILIENNVATMYMNQSGNDTSRTGYWTYIIKIKTSYLQDNNLKNIPLVFEML